MPDLWNFHGSLLTLGGNDVSPVTGPSYLAGSSECKVSLCSLVGGRVWLVWALVVLGEGIVVEWLAPCLTSWRATMNVVSGLVKVGGLKECV